MKYGYKVIDTEMINPSVKDWGRFKKEVDRIGVWQWDERYETPALDGTSWRVHIEWGQEKIDSSGSNCYPGNLEEKNGAFNNFLSVVKKLINDRPF